MMRRYPPHPVTLRQLQYVLAIADHGSFRKAAEACAVAQPSLSNQIAEVEDALGVLIFERLPRSVVVTDAGAAIVERARRAILEADDLVAIAQRARIRFRERCASVSSRPSRRTSCPTSRCRCVRIFRSSS